MESQFTASKILYAALCLTCALSVQAQMQIENIELTGLPVPGGVCTTPDAWFASGQLQVMFNMQEDGNGGIHLTWREQIKNGAIVDSNGDTYRVSGNAHEVGPLLTSVNDTSGGTLIVHDTWNIRVTPTKGSGGERQWLRGRLHVVVDSDGNANVINDRIEVMCEG